MGESYVYLSGRTNKTVLTISREESKLEQLRAGEVSGEHSLQLTLHQSLWLKGINILCLLSPTPSHLICW